MDRFPSTTADSQEWINANPDLFTPPDMRHIGWAKETRWGWMFEQTIERPGWSDGWIPILVPETFRP